VEPQSSLTRGVRQAPTTATREVRLGVCGIRLRGRHGIHPQERIEGNRFEIDVEIVSTCADAVETDDLVDTIDYREIADIVRTINDRQTFNLIESFAGRIADALFERFLMASDAIVKVSKLDPPGLGQVDRTVVQITRSRQ